ncbi:transposase [Desulfoscipio sp. XC116]|uniref:transposase n=1 Tax=Desulfoscipio sp. XC116 TaxID=3144975 RepID=UPI00325B2D23
MGVFDTDARPIRRGKAKVTTEFGHKVLIQEVENKIISNYAVYQGNPSDDTLLEDDVDKHEQTLGQTPKEVATDRGFGSKANEQMLKDKGVKRISLPYKSKKSAVRKAHEKQPWFKRLQRWRAGGETTISVLKRKYGLGRSLFRGTSGTKCWVGNSIFAYNLTKLARLSMV